MVADDVHLGQGARPARLDVIGVIVSRAAHVRNIGAAGHDLVGDAHGVGPGVALGDAQRFALAGEGELAALVMVAVLIDDAADIIR